MDSLRTETGPGSVGRVAGGPSNQWERIYRASIEPRRRSPSSTCPAQNPARHRQQLNVELTADPLQSIPRRDAHRMVREEHVRRAVGLDRGAHRHDHFGRQPRGSEEGGEHRGCRDDAGDAVQAHGPQRRLERGTLGSLLVERADLIVVARHGPRIGHV